MLGMNKQSRRDYENFMSGLEKRNAGEHEFIQAVGEVAASIIPFTQRHTQYRDEWILERMTEPDRIIIFRVSWEDDAGNVRANRAWRVQFNRAIGPYKGGMRFHESVNQSILKFLGFEQCFKNSLTGLPMGGGKGGANFSTKGRSDREIMRFCQSLMTELARHIGPDTDVPAGDIGVGAREIGFLFGQYMRIKNEYEGVLTGKGLAFGGSAVRAEATGWGCVYFCKHVMEEHGHSLGGQTAVISGSGNVAVFAAEKAISFGAKVVTLSDSEGFIYDRDGLDEEKLALIKEIKFNRRGRISEYADAVKGAKFVKGAKPWGTKCDVAFPCATENELDAEAARTLADNGVICVCEGANMPCTQEAVDHFHEHGILYAPGKAANAGGVAVSGLEQSQNAMRLSWGREEVDARLQEIMESIHRKCVDDGRTGKKGKPVNYVDGANIAGFRKLADAMLGYGVV
ncbi:NADP-specific glutamate dehydrogenase [soil metagenome]